MGERIPQSTSYELAFKVYSASTGLEVTGATVAMTISKNGATGAFSAMHVATNATEIASGWYFVVLDSTDTGTLGRLAVRGTSTGNQDVGVQLTVVDATNAGLTNLDTTITSRMATYTQPTGFLAATFPSGTVANTTNITAGTITTVSGNVNGNVAGSVASVTARVTANSDQVAGSASGATDLSKTTNAVARGTVTTGASTTSIPTSAFTLAGSAATGVVASQFVGRVVLFDGDTTTAGLRGAASVISASTASNTPTLTVAALPATPASGDTFSII